MGEKTDTKNQKQEKSNIYWICYLLSLPFARARVCVYLLVCVCVCVCVYLLLNSTAGSP